MTDYVPKIIRFFTILLTTLRTRRVKLLFWGVVFTIIGITLTAYSAFSIAALGVTDNYCENLLFETLTYTGEIPLDYFEYYQKCSEDSIEKLVISFYILLIGLTFTLVGSIGGLFVSLNEVWRQKSKGYDDSF